MMRRYNRWHLRFDQPDPYDGSYDLTSPQSFNRYSYVEGDPVNLTDPSGTFAQVGCYNPESGYKCPSPDPLPYDSRNWMGRWLNMYDYLKDLAYPKLKNANTEQQKRFDEAYSDLWRRLHENDGKNSCADFFGGIKKAEEALKNTKFSAGATKDPNAGAETSGSKVTINPTWGFFDTSGSKTLQVGLGYPPPGSNGGIRPLTITLGNVEAAAFILLHELGHRTGKLEPDGSGGVMSVVNSGKIREACFSEATPL